MQTPRSVAHAAIEGEFRALEITLAIPGAVDLVRRLAAQYSSEGVAVGAGTALDGHAAYECIRAGATFLVSPQLNSEMIRVGTAIRSPRSAGRSPPTEILESAEAGADIVKLFPTENAGIPYAKAVLAPLAHLPIMPAGGVTRSNPPWCTLLPRAHSLSMRGRRPWRSFAPPALSARSCRAAAIRFCRSATVRQCRCDGGG